MSSIPVEGVDPLYTGVVEVHMGYGVVIGRAKFI